MEKSPESKQDKHGGGYVPRQSHNRYLAHSNPERAGRMGETVQDSSLSATAHRPSTNTSKDKHGGGYVPRQSHNRYPAHSNPSEREGWARQSKTRLFPEQLTVHPPIQAKTCMVEDMCQRAQGRCMVVLCLERVYCRVCPIHVQDSQARGESCYNACRSEAMRGEALGENWLYCLRSNARQNGCI
ncbi:hypothetical protein VTN00DRAFT_6676 [Thermoascus crustaceus]|uniref:uncharacterized protein n=1 Tax=Thermoascus crustaceus TaxID=5088 RepID=UPI0037437711